MTQVNLYEAKTQLSKLVDRAAKGEDIVIAKNGEPVAVLVAPAKVTKPKREFGFLKAEMEALSDEAWEESDEEVRKLFAKSAREKL
ncbi:MAG TPA: type II toxin-antitoxin system prevent-host-death family antitoxin [Vitreimonas sp.]|uniref:type II toxin-antitoxin system Phd/YefM family antitoxin n=1 Tax=Vitreimonas sp. TaxID=3069702 RepID=UPI002D284A25|nr:type II toxin-antitoxin system prevent-host-death family antitoxin [Vitreimonas sp.]HYD89779.1 type II toxin-antitoxin system prevent-host-death family antitoxin [Vitreimonas sp.]